jgi:CCR4-NOT transcription complex subunit 4
MPFELKIDVDEDCAICCEPLNHDLNFYPCSCGFQLCSMCWHRIKNDESGNCPNCREPYKDEPYKFSPLTPDQEIKLKELRAREANQSATVKPKSAPAVSNSSFSNIELNREKLCQVRVMQKNLVFVVGLSTRIAEENVLRRNEYFGKYGKILKVAVNQSTSYAGTQCISICYL